MHFVGTDRALPSLLPPGDKTCQSGFDIFSSTVINLRDLEVCLNATSKIYDCLSIQIVLFSHFNNTCAYFRCVQTRHFLHAVVPPGGKTYQAGFAKLSSKEVKLRGLLVCFIATSNV